MSLTNCGLKEAVCIPGGFVLSSSKQVDSGPCLLCPVAKAAVVGAGVTVGKGLAS